MYYVELVHIECYQVSIKGDDRHTVKNLVPETSYCVKSGVGKAYVFKKKFLVFLMFSCTQVTGQKVTTHEEHHTRHIVFVINYNKTHKS